MVGQALETFIASLSTPVQTVAADSRQVTPGALFVAVTGGTHDGHDHIPAALDNGAVAIVGERSGLSSPVPYLQVRDARQALAYLAARQNGFPARRLTMIGVTGTDGKTTTANLLYHILTAAGLRVGMISTVNALLGDRVVDTGLHVTTPDAPAVQGYLAEMVRAGLTHCVLETTSHGLAQHRVSSCDLDVGIVTNITHEHLDYHGDYAAYRAAKAKLFEGLSQAARKPGQPKVAVLNADDSSYDYLKTIPADRQISYSTVKTADLTVRRLQSTSGETSFDLVIGARAYPVRSSLVGRYNVSNILAAAGGALALSDTVSPAAIQQGVASLKGLPGRMERIDLGQPFTVIVDFAHTPNALQRAIETGRGMVGAGGRVIAVFGSAGLRDVGKRIMMAEISARYADLTVLTAEDPRTEPLDNILKEMAAGCIAHGGQENVTFFRVRDRMRAIYRAMTMAQPGDVVLICGKGHEQSMCFGQVEYPWDDRRAGRAALAACLALQPSPDSGLPTARTKI